MLGYRLKAMRELKDLTQAEVANEIGLSRERYNQYENSRRAPDYDTLLILANFFEVSTDYLLGKVDDPIPIRDVDQDLHDEQDYDAQLKAFMEDDEMKLMFHDYDDWTDAEKASLLQILKGQKVLREQDKKK